MTDPHTGGTAKLKLLIAGGGTGGHVIPALAVAREWLSRAPNREAVFVGTQRGLETRLVPAAGLKLETIRSVGLKGMGPVRLARNLLQLAPALADSAAILRRHRVAAAFGVGGYAAGPVMLLAAMSGLPTVLFEPNAAAGFSNRLLAMFVTRMATGYPSVAESWGARARFTGCPVRPEFFCAPAQSARTALPRPDYRRQPGRARNQPRRHQRPRSPSNPSRFPWYTRPANATIMKSTQPMKAVACKRRWRRFSPTCRKGLLRPISSFAAPAQTPWLKLPRPDAPPCSFHSAPPPTIISCATPRRWLAPAVLA